MILILKIINFIKYTYVIFHILYLSYTLCYKKRFLLINWCFGHGTSILSERGFDGIIKIFNPGTTLLEIYGLLATN